MANTPSTMLELGTPLPPFHLPDFNGVYTSSDKFKGSPVLVMFICNHCPFVKHVASTLSELAKTYQSKGVGVVAINSNDVSAYPADSPENMAGFAAQHHFSLPYLFDETQEVARAFRAACTPDFYLFDSSHRLVYRGQMDDSRPSNGIPVTGKDLTDAVEKLLAGESVSPEQMPSLGCNIKWKPGNEPDYFG
jgi:thiol-disulfide isomerase/thioredoxin